jgi:hypothetical protein
MHDFYNYRLLDIIENFNILLSKTVARYDTEFGHFYVTPLEIILYEGNVVTSIKKINGEVQTKVLNTTDGKVRAYLSLINK